jgi:hypothetical protein
MSPRRSEQLEEAIWHVDIEAGTRGKHLLKIRHVHASPKIIAPCHAYQESQEQLQKTCYLGLTS